MADEISPEHMQMNPAFPAFPNIQHPGEKVQVALHWLENVATLVSLTRLSVPAPTLRVMELAAPTDPLDFHLTFRADSGFVQDIHFCIRHREGGKNACLYWHYELVRDQGGRLEWNWKGWAGKGDGEAMRRYRTKGLAYGLSAGGILNRLLTALTKTGHTLERARGRWTLSGP
jgi:hypothetical protein